MDDARFSRLENRVDEIKDDLSDVKAEQKITNNNIESLKEYMDKHSKLVSKHVTGDEKIITEIAPIIEEFKFQQEKRRRRIEAFKVWGTKLMIPSIIIGMLAGIAKIVSSFQ